MRLHLDACSLSSSEEENFQVLATCLSSLFTLQANYLVDIACVSKKEMQTLNKQYRSIDQATDVLSFPTLSPETLTLPLPHTSQKPLPAGSIFICKEKAEEYGETVFDMVCHGLIHILGYDHETNLEEWLEQEQALQHALTPYQLSFQGVPHGAA